MRLSCRCCSGRVRNSFPSNQNGRKSFRNALMLAAYNLEVSSPAAVCILDTPCYHRYAGLQPIICGLQVTPPESISNLALSVAFHIHINVSTAFHLAVSFCNITVALHGPSVYLKTGKLDDSAVQRTSVPYLTLSVQLSSSPLCQLYEHNNYTSF